MLKKTVIRKNAYYDSVTLMSLTSKILGKEGVNEAVITMATDMNKEQLRGVGLSTEDSDKASTSDLILAVSAQDQESLEAAFDLIQELLSPKKNKGKKGEEKAPESIGEALEIMEDANMAIISVPGAFAYREAKEALEKGLNVMIFSDNVSIEEEKELKEMGRDKGLFVMGPDCGTASIGGAGLCFANDVRSGDIGIVGASGTGLQEVMVQVHHMGGGITHGIGTGGRDLKEEIGGIMMIEGIRALSADEATKVMVLVSKPPAKSVGEKIFQELNQVKKPVVVCFLDGEAPKDLPGHIYFVKGLFEAAEAAVSLSQGKSLTKTPLLEGFDVSVFKSKLNENQKYLRGLYCGGTLTAETLSILRDQIGGVTSNVAKKVEEKLNFKAGYKGNVLIDLGEDEFTVGRPHPMIEPSLRNDHILREAKDPSVGVILLDFELGYGSHEDPAGVTLTAINEAREAAKVEGREIVFVGYVLGTELDKQDYKLQRRLLKEEGILIFDSNREAALAAGMIIG